MDRKRIGPRKLHGPQALWQAVYRTDNGKTFRESLGTRNHVKAMTLWPAALKRCQDRANGVEPSWTPEKAQKARENFQAIYDRHAVDELDLAADLTGEAGDKSTKELAIFISDRGSMPISWEQAFEIHNKKIGAKRGRPVADSSKEAQANARKGVTIPPLSFSVRDVQEYVQRLEDQGLSANTISQKPE